MKTEERIVNKALEMFNEKGIEYVGLREIAATLQMRVSNITYYFPTKDDLVYRLSLDLNKANSVIVREDEKLTISGFIEMFRQVFNNHIRYRCMLLSVVHLMSRNKIMAERYKNTKENRNAALSSNIKSLINNGFLNIKTEAEIDHLVSLLGLIARFWISEATVTLNHLDEQSQIQHYLKNILFLLNPHATKKGSEQINEELQKL